MSAPITELPTYDEKRESDDSLAEKKGVDDDVQVDVIDDKHLRDVEEFEDRLAHDEAADEEYLVQNAHDVAIKVRLSPTLATVPSR